MKTVIQRVKQASVKVDGKIIGKINKGLLILLAIHKDDIDKDIDWMVGKILNLRIFPDGDDKMNLSVQDVNGSILVVSQFTLYGDCKKGNRPSFVDSAQPVKAKKFYERFIDKLKVETQNIASLQKTETQNIASLRIETGRFQEHMEVSLINDGPTTVIVESRKL